MTLPLSLRGGLQTREVRFLGSSRFALDEPYDRFFTERLSHD